MAPSEALLRDDHATLWDSGKVVSEQSVHLAYAGKPLASHAACWWKVRVWDQDAKVSEWSTPARWTMGLLDAEDWSARWIGLDGGEESDEPFTVLKASLLDLVPRRQPAIGRRSRTRFFRRTVHLPEGRRVARPIWSATADDAFVAFVNGRSVGCGRSWAELNCSM